MSRPVLRKFLGVMAFLCLSASSVAARSTPQNAAVPAAPVQTASPTAAANTPVPGGTAPAQAALPPTAPTVLKQTAPTNTYPPLPAPLPAAVASRGTSTPNPRPANQASTESTPGNRPRRIATNLGSGPLTDQPAGTMILPGGIRVSGLGGSSAPWSIVLLLTTLTLIPSLLICVTPFARLLVVFHFLRQALGLQTTPSNQTLIGLTLILTFFIMEPVGKQIYNQSFLPLQSGQITPFEAIARGQDPLRDFMSHYVREKDAALFLEIAHEPRPHNVHDLSMRVLLPAYIVSELKAGFQIGAVLFLPFLVVDMVVASITTSVGMMQLPPVVISTPLKLLLFLMVDGWHLLIGALMRSFT